MIKHELKYVGFHLQRDVEGFKLYYKDKKLQTLNAGEVINITDPTILPLYNEYKAEIIAYYKDSPIFTDAEGDDSIFKAHLFHVYCYKQYIPKTEDGVFIRYHVEGDGWYFATSKGCQDATQLKEQLDKRCLRRVQEASTFELFKLTPCQLSAQQTRYTDVK